MRLRITLYVLAGLLMAMLCAGWRHADIGWHANPYACGVLAYLVLFVLLMWRPPAFQRAYAQPAHR